MKRIQRKRTKGWRMPPNTVYVGRPTKWGNPFSTFGGDMMYCFSVNRKILSPWILWYHDAGYTEKDAVLLYKQWLIGNIKESYLPESPIADIAELKGKDLTCWCPLDKPCHADILIEICNEKA